MGKKEVLEAIEKDMLECEKVADLGKKYNEYMVVLENIFQKGMAKIASKSKINNPESIEESVG